METRARCPNCGTIFPIEAPKMPIVIKGGNSRLEYRCDNCGNVQESIKKCDTCGGHSWGMA